MDTSLGGMNRFGDAFSTIPTFRFCREEPNLCLEDVVSLSYRVGPAYLPECSVLV